MAEYVIDRRHDYESKDHSPVHERANWEFQAAVRGACAPVLRDGPQPLREQHLWVFPPSTAHGWRGVRGRPCRVVVFHYGSVPQPLEYFVLARQHFSRPITRREAAHLIALAGQLRPEIARPTPLTAMRSYRALLDLSFLVLKGVDPKELPRVDTRASQKLDAALAWYSNRMAERPKLSDVARAAGMSPTHLWRTFTREYMQTPHAVLKGLQFKRAMELMTQTPLTLEGVAERCGFGSASDFSRSFKARHRMSPSAWMKGRREWSRDRAPEAPARAPNGRSIRRG